MNWKLFYKFTGNELICLVIGYIFILTPFKRDALNAYNQRGHDEISL